MADRQAAGAGQPRVEGEQATLRLCIIGAGRIGSTLAFRLTRNGGHHVTVVARPQSERLSQLRRDGGIVAVSGERASVEVRDELDAEADYDLVVLTLLSHQLETILPALSRSRAKRFLSMVNMVEPVRLVQALGADRVVLGMPFMQANFDEGGRLNAKVGAGGLKSLVGSPEWVERFEAAGIPAALEPRMADWLRSHAPLCIAFEAVAVAGEKRGGGARWRQAMALAKGVGASVQAIRLRGAPIYPRSKRLLYRLPAPLLASVFWTASRNQGFRALLSTGSREAEALAAQMTNDAQAMGRRDLAHAIERMKPSRLT